jgi:hypothetical protein
MRDIVVIGLACLLAIGLGVWLYVDGSAPVPPSSSGAVEWRVLGEGQDAGSVTERTNYRIKTAAEFEELLSIMYGGAGPSFPTGVNFEKEEVLAVFDGTHSSGGYAIAIESIVDDGLTRKVSLIHREPGEDCMTTSAITSPFLLVAVPKTQLALSKTERTEVVSCN